MLRFVRCYYGRIDQTMLAEQSRSETIEPLMAEYHGDDMRPGESRFIQVTTSDGWHTTSSRVATGGAAVPGDPGARSVKAHRGTDRVTAILQLAYAEPSCAGIDPNVFLDFRLEDLLADVLHFCDGHGLDYAGHERNARSHYDEERNPAYAE